MLSAGDAGRTRGLKCSSAASKEGPRNARPHAEAIITVLLDFKFRPSLLVKKEQAGAAQQDLAEERPGVLHDHERAHQPNLPPSLIRSRRLPGCMWMNFPASIVQ